MLEELVEAWRTNNRINCYLIDHIDDAGMSCTVSKRGGRDVARQFSHIHNVRVWHLERRAKDLATGLEQFESKVSPGRARLRKALSAPGAAVEAFLTGVLSGEPKRRGLRKGIFTTLGYFIAHESHHRGNILLTLKICGHNIDQKHRYAIWDSDRM